MQKVVSIGMIVLLILCGSSTLLYCHCKKDKCEGIICTTTDKNATCADGTCTCSPGFEGDRCLTLSRDKIVGSYEVNETCGGTGNRIYNAAISIDGDDKTKALIYNIDLRFASPVSAMVDKSTVTIADQAPDNNNIHISGSGTISGDLKQISLTYSISGNVTDACSNSIWTKQ